MAIVGDGGRHEVIETVDGRTYLTPKVDTLVHLGKGDKVHKSVDAFLETSEKMANKPAKIEALQKADESLALLVGLKQVEKAITAKKETHFHWDNGQLAVAEKRNGAWTTYINRSVYE
jgi:hypothetical protein